jgi:hypothetical protein
MVDDAFNLLRIVVVKSRAMQLFYGIRQAVFCGRYPLCALALHPFLIAAGCIERPTTIDPAPARPHSGVVLQVAVQDQRDRELVRQLAASWANRSGAEVRILESPWDGTADIGIIATADLARWAEPGLIVEVPATVRSQSHAYRWDDVVSVHRVRLTSWRDRTYALPVLGEGLVLVYRKDAFDGKGGRPASPPGTWDTLLQNAEMFGPNSLPPLPSDAERLGAEFFSAAACYDRMAVGRISAGDLKLDDSFFAFQFDTATGKPRLDAPAFQHVAELFRRMQTFRSPAPDAITAFRDGQAKVGIVSLAELAPIVAALGDRVAVAPLPGAGFVFDAKGEKQVTEQQTINRVPYHGWGGRVGVVSKKCSAPEAAWEFLADVGMPEHTALDLIAATRWGAGPYRSSQLDARARPRWFSYGMSAPETDRLTASLRENAGQNIQNNRVRLRTPNQEELAMILDAELRAAVKAKEPASLAKVNARWQAAIDKLPTDEWWVMTRRSLGLADNPYPRAGGK